ncbi:hypothetical protein Fmac_015560 [Flemingia macrophylla]|uniref:Disease resistance protein Roq1-like winged-helix domain-containing protein n=1 Tax=Flemingia macrophylla TaxID=520843 RepID=A0ABD1MEW7_9FABA
MKAILKVSFDALNDEVKSVFLDIACCFKGYEMTYVEHVLGAHYGYNIKPRLEVLVEKSLLKYGDARYTMHDLIEEMGKNIVNQEFPDEPAERSRLWSEKDIIEILEENKKVHNSIGFLEKLIILDAEGCSNLKSFPPLNLPSLKVLEIEGCSSIEIFSPINLSSIEEFHLSGCSSLRSFSEITEKMDSLYALYLEGLSIAELPWASFQNLCRLEHLYLNSCGVVQLPSESMVTNKLKRHELGDWICFPGESVPEWFHQRSTALSCSFWFRDKFPLRILCCFVAPRKDYDSSYLIPHAFINGKLRKHLRVHDISPTKLDHTYFYFLAASDRNDNNLSKKGWNHVELLYYERKSVYGQKCKVRMKEVGIHVMMKGGSMIEDVRFSDPSKN